MSLIHLKEWQFTNSNAGGEYVKVPYPSEPVTEFIDFLRTSEKTWQLNPKVIHQRYRRMQLQLLEIRTVRANVVAERAAPKTLTDASEKIMPKGMVQRVQDEINRLRHLGKAKA